MKLKMNEKMKNYDKTKNEAAQKLWCRREIKGDQGHGVRCQIKNERKNDAISISWNGAEIKGME